MSISTKIFFRVDPRTKLCPDCNKMAVLKRSHSRNVLEKIIKLFTPLSTYRCKECGWRGFQSGYAFTKDSFKAILVYLVLLIGTIVVVSFLLKRFMIK